jgi:guanylate kinase
MVISCDFDGTICKQEYPFIGDILPNAKYCINYLYNRGHTIVINTCRALHYAEQAKIWLEAEGIKYDYFNENDSLLIERYGTDTRKISADVYIDDKSLNDVTLKKMIGLENYNNQLWNTSLKQFEFIEKPCIICIIGESGAGKSLAAKYLYNHYNINLVNSYTNRKQRNPEDTDHIFLSTKEYNDLLGEKLAETTFGEKGKEQYSYCSLTNDMSHINTYLITEDGLEMLQKEWGEVYDIYSVRIHRGEFDRRESVGDERVDRDKGRFNMKDTEFNYVINNDSNKKEYLYKELGVFMRIFRLESRAEEFNSNML